MTKDQRLCISCQECCKWMTFTVPVSDEDMCDYFTSFYKARGCKVLRGIVVERTVLAIMIPSVCPQLTEFGCKDYDNRPEACRQYDGRTDPLMKDMCVLPKEVSTDG